MPNWAQVKREIDAFPQPVDAIRMTYLRKLHEKTGRNVLCYYSGFLQRKDSPVHLSIDDADKNGFMACVHELDRTKGCDLLLHTPGGELAATESLVDYLHQMFGNDIRAIVPQIAMSAGTMIACACKEIIMGKQSNIGPVDPQFGGLPAQSVISQLKEAGEAVKKDPSTRPVWYALLKKYDPVVLQKCKQAVEMSDSMMRRWLGGNMLAGDSNSEALIEKIMKNIGSNAVTKLHSRHIHIKEAKKIGLKVKSIEDKKEFDDEFQDLILTIHHCFMHAFSQTQRRKIIENHAGIQHSV